MARHILRTLRLQLKTGFIKQAPEEYAFLRRYPPLHRDLAEPVRALERSHIPYLRYYEQAVSRNALYADEKVYPGYWAHEPQALTLAKKQYEYIQGGDSEEQAYQKAVAYVDELENESYEQMHALMQELGKKQGARLPYVSDAKVTSTIAEWRQKLSVTPYYEMGDADQGEIDYVLQTMVLKWNEVERERRMKDPIFIMQFERLREAIFPEILASEATENEKRKPEEMNLLASMYGVSPSRLSTRLPFFYEEYVAFFEKLKQQPHLVRWSAEENRQLGTWIFNTLAVREIIETKPTAPVQKYLDLLRAQFFPMVRYPDQAASFSLPDVQTLKALLYENDVGYKVQDEKLFVRRFYRLPRLLFPKETYKTTMTMTKDYNELFEKFNSDQGSLADDMARAGIDEATIPELEAQIREMVNDKKHLEGEGLFGTPIYASSSSSDQDKPSFSQLDLLLNDVEDLEDEAKAKSASSALSSASIEEDENDEDGELDEEEEEEEEDQQQLGETDLDSSYTLSSKPRELYREDEWEALVSKYVKKPTTRLEQERDELLSATEYYSWQSAEDEVALEEFRRTRKENELIVRARCWAKYEKKEAARRSREWERRKMIPLSNPVLELIDNRE